MKTADSRIARFAASLLCMSMGLSAHVAFSAIPATATDVGIAGSPGWTPAPYTPLTDVAVEQCNIVWTGAGDGTRWDADENWSAARVPGPNDVACIASSDRAIVALASWNGVPAGTGYAVLSDGSAGEATYVAGIGVDPAFRMRGVGTALSAWLIQQSGTDRMAHLHPDSDSAARIYGRLGFVEVPGFDVYVDIE